VGIFRVLRTEQGFTLTELTVVVALMAVMMGVGYSGYSSVQQRQKVRAAAYRLAGDIREARALAIERHVSHVMEVGGNQYTICREGGATIDGMCGGADDTDIRSVDVSQGSAGISIDPNPARTFGFPLHFDVKGMPKDVSGVMTAGSMITLINVNVTVANNVHPTYTVSVSSLGSITVETTPDLY